jgi:AcrR family transcriptional regulator
MPSQKRAEPAASERPDGHRSRRAAERPGHRPVQLSQSSPPATAKGRRTRAQLLHGARLAFEQSGSYTETRITDIAEKAGVAYGTFYTYFDSKEALFLELANEVVNELYREGTSAYRGRDRHERVAAANRQIIISYRKHAVFMALIEQAAALYPEFHELRRDLRRRFVDRIAANVRQWQERGEVDTNLNHVFTAHALVSMTDNLCYLWFVMGEPVEEEVAVDNLTRIWINVLKLA